jgi:hypothetical protein
MAFGSDLRRLLPCVLHRSRRCDAADVTAFVFLVQRRFRLGARDLWGDATPCARAVAARRDQRS